MIITITLNPALDRTLRIEHPLEVGKLNRSSSSHRRHERPRYEGHADGGRHPL